MLRELDVPVEALPIVIVPGRPLLRNPSNRALLDALGLSDTDEDGPSSTCDLLVVGGGPSGLSAAVYGASEGLATVLAEDTSRPSRATRCWIAATPNDLQHLAERSVGSGDVVGSIADSELHPRA